MAASVAFGAASNILSTIVIQAYKRGFSISEAREELDKFRMTIETIQAVLLDAEKKQTGSVVVKDLIKRLKDVVYEAEDLFDEVATDDLAKKQMMERNNKLSLKNKVRVFFSELNPIVSSCSIAKDVKAIKKKLDEIYDGMALLGLLGCQHEKPLCGMRVEKNPGSFVDPKHVFGRDEDKKTILEMLFNESNDVESDGPPVIAIVGIGGMGKTTLAQLIYNDIDVKRNFINCWFACISDIPDEKQVLDTRDEKQLLEKIFKSMSTESYSGLTVSELKAKISNSIEGKTFLLVLDDVWGENHARWKDIMRLLDGGAKGSKIIVTTRSSSVAEAVDAFKTHMLQGLSEDDSWNLFKSFAFNTERENDRRWIALGREMVKKCARVPLAIRSLGSLLYTKTTIQEWESIIDQELSKLEGQGDADSIMAVLQLSYDHLPSNLKHCFGYCSIFPKDFVFNVQKLVYLWIAQGYIKPNERESVEAAGHSYFMSLLRRSFFQEAKVEDAVLGEIASCKMHDLVHDLAKYVAGEETVVLRMTFAQSYNSARHVRVGCETIDAGEILPQKLNMRMLRSFMLVDEGFLSRALDLPYRSSKCLRALCLSGVGIENVPSSIRKLKLLRYLDLSRNKFKRLPNSITSLLNLVALDLYECMELEALPDDFRKLINLRYLNIGHCDKLKHMPPRFGELYSLQYLSHFKVGKAMSEEEGVESKRSGLDALAGLVHLRGELGIHFEDVTEDWDRDKCSWQLPVSPQGLLMYQYPGIRIPHWANDQVSQLPNLVRISLEFCPKVKYLPHFRYLPHLKLLRIYRMEELEYMEEEEEMNEPATGFVNDVSLFFPSLEILHLLQLSKLKGWSGRNDIATTSTTPMQKHPHLSFPILSQIMIDESPDLKSMPSSPHICDLDLGDVCGEAVEELLSSTSSNPTTPSSSSSSSCLKTLTIRNRTAPISFLGSTLASLTSMRIVCSCWPIGFSIEALTSIQFLEFSMVDDLEILLLALPYLTRLTLWRCSGLTSVQVKASAPGLCIELSCCSQLKSLHFDHPDVVEELLIDNCPELGLKSVNWDSFSKLRRLKLSPLPPLEELPKCHSNLQITEYFS